VAVGGGQGRGADRQAGGHCGHRHHLRHAQGPGPGASGAGCRCLAVGRLLSREAEMSDVQSASDNYQGVWGQRIGFGRKPALLLIDFMQGYTTPGAPLYAPGVVSAVEQAAGLLALARDCGTLVVHTNIRYQPPHFADGGVWVRMAPVMKDMVEGNPLAAFCEA